VTGQARRTDVDETRAGQPRDTRAADANLSTSLSLGKLSLRQSLRAADDVSLVRPAFDTLPELPHESRQRISWSSGFDYQQRLFGTTTFTPGLSIDGESARLPATEGEFISRPTRLNFNSRLQTDIFGFWPGIGQFSRVRHRVSPGFTYTYSPEVKPDSLQRTVFSAGEVRETNRVSISLSQTFEAKVRGAERPDAEADAATADTAGAPGAGPRVLPQDRKVTILSLNTDAIAYDFVQARADTIGQWPGLQTGQLRNSVTSDLLRGLTLSFTHDLFERAPLENGGLGERSFAPHLSNVSANFSLGSGSWLFRVLGGALGGGGPQQDMPSDAFESTPTDPEVAAPSGLGGGLMGRGAMGMGGGGRSAPAGQVGHWNASVQYMMTRPRQTALESRFMEETQMLSGNLSFRPTQQWSVHWRTGYSINRSEFDNQIMTLTRDLHDWEAHFDFVKAQNGNFSFNFRVQLRANPDIKLDYEQRGGDAFRAGDGVFF
jgi:hypothetical protein